MFQSDKVGVRWQAEMEDHLKGVKENLHIKSDDEPTYMIARASMAQAHATAALALAVANGLDDIEHELNNIYHAITEGK